MWHVARSKYPIGIGSAEAPGILMIHFKDSQKAVVDDTDIFWPGDEYNAIVHGGHTIHCPIVFRIEGADSPGYLPPPIQLPPPVMIEEYIEEYHDTAIARNRRPPIDPPGYVFPDAYSKYG